MSIQFYILHALYGDSLFDEYVTSRFDLARQFAQIISEDQYFELFLEPDANIVCFRYREPSWSDLETNEKNNKLREQVLLSGDYYLVKTTLGGDTYLRTSIMNPHTTSEDLQNLLANLKESIRGMT